MTTGGARLPVAIGLISGGEARVEYFASLWIAQAADAFTDWIMVPSGPYLDVGRNKVVDAFVALNDEHTRDDEPINEFLLMTDSDIAFTPDDIRAVVGAAQQHHADDGVWPIVCGGYYGVSPEGEFLVSYGYSHEPGQPPVMTPLAKSVVDADGPDLIPVAGSGTGFMLIHRDILEHFREFYEPPMVWFCDEISDGGWFGEDLMFCRRAAAIGHPTFLHREVRLTHYKTVGLSFKEK